MISYSKAQEIIRSVAQTRQALMAQDSASHSLSKNLTEAVGGILAEDLHSQENLPSFDNSSMDGFALFSSDTLQASVENPVLLKRIGMSSAGDPTTKIKAERSTCIEIMTGAPLPAGYDAILKVEDATVVERDGDSFLQISKPVLAESFVRRMGSDISTGQLLMKGGQTLERTHLLALAGLGFGKVPVQRRLRIARISTGREIVEHTQTPGPGQIRNSTAPYLDSLFESLNLELVHEATVGDEPSDFMKEMKTAFEKSADIIVSTGAVSMGKFDFIGQCLEKLEANIHFHKVAIQPGKPLLFASLPQGPIYFGLPGNPVSGVVGFRFFVESYLREWRGQSPEKPIQVPLLKMTKKPAGLTQLAKAILRSDKGQLRVEVLSGQMSYMLKPLFETNAWAVLPADSDSVSEGTLVDTFPLYSNSNFTKENT